MLLKVGLSYRSGTSVLLKLLFCQRAISTTEPLWSNTSAVPAFLWLRMPLASTVNVFRLTSIVTCFPQNINPSSDCCFTLESA